jgi:diacylglycerol kinase family enzyme
MADDWRPRRVDLARVNGRHFVFSAGVGLDASVVERVDAHPRLKARLGEWYYTWTAIGAFNRRYLIRPPRLEAELAGDRVQGVTAIVQNGSPYTYFGDRPVQLVEGAALDSGDLAGIVLRRGRPVDMPTIAWRALSRRAEVARHRHIHPFTGLQEMRVRSCDQRPLPLQVDGDYIGETHEAMFSVVPRGITVIS